jgi:hypothetical protein
MRFVKSLPRAHIAVYLFYLAVAILITWPLLTVFSTHFPGFADGDAHEMTRHIWWFTYALQHGQPLIFQPLLGYPAGIQGVILWSDPLQFFPGWLFALFMPLPAAYNLFVLLTLALNGWAAYWLVEHLLRHCMAFLPSPKGEPQGVMAFDSTPFPALFAGIIFMTAPVMQGHLAGGHGGLLVQWPLPLLVYALLKLCWPSALSSQPLAAKQPTRNFKLFTLNFSPINRYVFLIAFFVFLTPLGHTLQLIYAVMPLAGVIGFTLLMRRKWKVFLRLILAVGLGCALLLIFLLPVFNATFGTSAYTEESGGVRYSADLLAIVTPSFEHILFGQLDFTHRVLGINIVEGSAYIGIVTALLAVVAIWKVKVARWWLALALVAWILSLGPLLKVFDTPLQTTVDGSPTYITLPWALLYNLPGFSLARTPGRFDFLLALAAAVLSGYGASVLFSALSTQHSALGKHSALSTFIFVVLAALVLFEYQSFWPLPTYSAEIPQAVYDLAKRDDVRAVFDIPWENVLAAKDALWLQTAHEKPMIAGQVTRSTPVDPAKLTILQQTLDPALLKDAGVDVVIVHKKVDAALAETVRQHFGTPFYEDDRIALFNVPQADGQPQLTALIEPDTGGYIYTPESGWATLTGTVVTDGQAVDLRLDNQLVDRWTGDRALNLLLPLPSSGYHALTIANHLTCPEHNPAVQQCLSLKLNDLAITGFKPAVFRPLQWDGGVQLAGAFLADVPVALGLWWQFDQSITDQDIRFVKVLDEQGNQVAGDDHPLGAFAAGTQSLETLDLTLPADLAPGTYNVYVGWYSYPGLNRFAVLTDVPGAQDGLAYIGEFTR